MTDDKESISTELADDAKLLSAALGGPRGMFESAAPAIVFITSYAVTSQNLSASVYAAITTGLVLAIFRLVKKQTLSQVFAGFIGLGFSAWLAMRSGRAEDFFLPGILTNFLYAAATLISLVINKPILGYVIESIKGTGSKWLTDAKLVKRYRTMTYLWFGVFSLRVVIMTPLYLANQLTALGFFKLALGWPLFALAGYATYALSRRKN